MASRDRGRRFRYKNMRRWPPMEKFANLMTQKKGCQNEKSRIRCEAVREIIHVVALVP